MATNIRFSTGEKEYIVNDDESKVIRVNVSDANILVRYNESLKKFEKLHDEIGDLEDTEQLKRADLLVRGFINDVFDTDVCTPAFGNTNCLSPVGNGKALYQSFLEAFLPIVKKDIEARLNASNIHLEEKAKTFTDQLSQRPVQHDVTNLSDEDIKRIAAAIKGEK